MICCCDIDRKAPARHMLREALELSDKHGLLGDLHDAKQSANKQANR